MRTRHAPVLAVLGAVGAGLVLVVLGHWRAGSYVIGLALLLAAGLRLSLPADVAGLLVVRSRGLDGGLLLALGFGVLLLADSVPSG